MRRFRAAVLMLALSGCVYVTGVMWRRAEEKRSRVLRIALGQSLGEVRAIMGKDPEKREARLRFDGKKVELWTYVTDYTRKVDSTIIFLDGRVQEIRATSWCEAD